LQVFATAAHRVEREPHTTEAAHTVDAADLVDHPAPLRGFDAVPDFSRPE
jgi:hypothetical protein